VDVSDAVQDLLAHLVPGAAEVLFVFMPIAGIERPSMGVSLLKACLKRQGIKAEVIYANIAFASVIDLPQLAFIDRLGTMGPAPEWFFASSAFGDQAPDEEKGLASFTSALELQRILDPKFLRAALEEIRRKAEEFVEILAPALVALEPRIVACSSVFFQHVASLAICRRVAELDPSIITMLGGSSCEAEMGLATHQSFPWIDFVVSGEADELIGELCRKAIDQGRACSADQLPLGVFGPCHRENGYPATSDDQRTVARAKVSAINDIPCPDFHDYFHALTTFPERAQKITPSLQLETSRGCWWGEKHLCKFCGLNGEGISFRSKSSDRVLGELHELSERYGINRVEAVDNILDMRFFNNLLPELARQGAPYNVFYEVKANLKRNQVSLLADAGIRMIQPGIESLDSRILRLMDKGTSAVQNLLLLKWCKESDVRVVWNFLCGFPGEEDRWYEEMAQWMPLIEHLTPPTGVARLQFHRFSVYDLERARYGLRLKPHPDYKLIYPEHVVTLQDLVYHFEDYNEKIAKLLGIAAPRPGLAKVVARVSEWRRKWGSGQPTCLIALESNGQLKIFDQRTARTADVHVLDDSSARLYALIEDGPTRTTVERAAHDELGLSTRETGRLLHGFLERKLALEIDGRIVGLATRTSVPGRTILDAPATAHIDLPENWPEMLMENLATAVVGQD
jgi:ribosomal peptide maturation radical SAM protein 1